MEFQLNEFEVTPEEPLGGAIVFSTDVNAVTLCGNVLCNVAGKWLYTLQNRLFVRRKVESIITRYNAIGEGHITNFTLLRQRGSYMDPAGVVYNEHSVRLELLGAGKAQLTTLATMLLPCFRQLSVMVILYGDNAKFHIRVAKS